MTELNWLIDLGFTRRELRGLPGNTLLLLTDQYEQFALEHNMKFVLQYFDRQDVLQFLVRYPMSFAKNTDTIRRRLNEVILQLGEKEWKQILLDQFSQCPDDCIIGAIGANDECDWECALDRIELLRDGLWL